MHHIALTPFRGPATLAQLAAARQEPPARPADKWRVLADLRVIRERLGLTDRSLSVLQALLSFLPSRELRPGEPMVVYPSNATLADRANGIPESTLRRHLAALVSAGLVARRDSPNGKRYSTRGPAPQAFGFDLSPLQARAAEIAGWSQEAAEEALRLRDARSAVVLLLRDATKLATLARSEGLSVPSSIGERLDEARCQLRRKPREDVLGALDRNLRALLDDLHKVFSHSQMSANDAQNERHLQNSISETHVKKVSREGTPPDRPARLQAASDEPEIPLALIVKACPAALDYAPTPPRTWRDLIDLAEIWRAWLGIAAIPWAEAKALLGPARAAATLAVIVQRAGIIRNPGAYLRSLAMRHVERRFSLPSLIHSLLAKATSSGET